MQRKTEWVSIAALGIAIVAAGYYVAWNYGIAAGGWAGMIIAVGFAAALYLALATCMAELCSMFQSEAAAVEFVRQGFGASLGAAAGWCVMSEFVGAGAALGAFFGSYGHAISGLPQVPLILALFGTALALQMLGARDVLWVTQCMTVIALMGVLITIAYLLGTAETRPHNQLQISTIAADGLSLVPKIWAAIPYAVALFLGIEGIALTVEQVDNPARAVPRALLSAVGAQCVLVYLLILIVPANVDFSELTRIADPIAFAWQTIGEQGVRGVMGKLCTGCALVAIATSFFSVMFAYSRQLHAFSHEGFVPRFFARVNRKGAPVISLVAPSTVAFVLAAGFRPELLVVLMVFGATASYLLIFGAHLRLRQTAPNQTRVYRAPGQWVPVFGILLTGATFLACMRNHRYAAFLVGIAILLLSTYSARRSRQYSSC